jgi:hypothetical protein
MASSANSVGNTLNAKNLTVQAQGDWTITGGEINTDTSNVRVGGDMTVAAGQDLAFHEKTVKTTQLVIGGSAGVGGYEASGFFGLAPDIDTQLASPFDGQEQASSSLRNYASAGRSAGSQALATQGSGSRNGANKGRGGTSGANVKVGLETVTTTDTTESTTYRNAQLNLGSGSVDVAGTFDLGGADINAGYQLSPEERAKMTAEQRVAATEAMPTLDISAGDIKTSKYESTEKTSHTREELFLGFTAEVHSSLADVATQVAQTAHKALGTDAVNDPNAPAGSSKTQAMADGKMEIDPALTAIAAAGMATQVAFGEVAGYSATVGMQHTIETSDSQSRAENINQIGGNISLTSTQGDIALNGVNLQGGKVAIKSAGNLTQQAAKSSSASNESVTTHTVGLTGSAGVAPTGVGIGASAGASGSYDETSSKSTHYTNGLISGTEVSIETAGDHTLIGANIKGNQVDMKVGGNQTITSVQDTSEMDHTRSNWSASIGVAVTTNGIIQGTGSGSASGGQDFDNSKLVAEQAGISADSLDLNVAGNLNLTGAHITSNPGQGSVDVGGKIISKNLHDSREKDGGYAGGGGGISKNGLPSVTLEFGRVDQVHYHADNLATVDVGDPSKVTAAQGISGQLNTDADKQLNVTQNKRVAGTDVRIEISVEDAEEIKTGVKKVFTGKSSGGKYVVDAPKTRSGQLESSKPKTSQVGAPKAGYTDMPAAKPKPNFDQRVIVNTDTHDPTVNKAVQNLANKHPDNTVVIAPTANGGHEVLSGNRLSGGSTKVEVVGHGENGTSLGGLDSKQITDLVQNLKADSQLQVDKLNLVGCGTACAQDGRSLVADVSGMLQQQDSPIDVKGYDGRIDIDEQGHKRPVEAGGLLRVAKDAPLKTKAPRNANQRQNSPAATRNGAEVLYASAFQRVAEKYKAVIGLRAPNPLGASLLTEGFPSKNFHVKAKSSPTGPTAGFIAESPEYSKVPVEKHGVQKKYIGESVKKGAELVPLNLSPQRVQELVNTGDMKSLGDGRYAANYPSGIQYFSIGQDGAVSNSRGEPVRVLTNPPEVGADSHHPLPITADYDLFSISPKISQNYNETPFQIGARFAYGEWDNKNLPQFSSSLPEGKASDPNMGNISHYTRTIVRSLNKEAQNEGYKGGPLVWHGDEANNPFSPGFDPNDKPIFFVPGKKPVQINSMEELVKFQEQLQRDGYSPGTSNRF